VYDMYPWDSASQGDYPPEPLRSWRDPSPRDTRKIRDARKTRETSPARAVQIALDRRDNGGDAAGPPAALPAAAPPAPGAHATPPRPA
jgi:hypothetical protein